MQARMGMYHTFTLCDMKWFMDESCMRLLQYDPSDIVAIDSLSMKLTNLMSLEDRTTVRHHNILQRIRNVRRLRHGKRCFI